MQIFIGRVNERNVVNEMYPTEDEIIESIEGLDKAGVENLAELEALNIQLRDIEEYRKNNEYQGDFPKLKSIDGKK